MMNHLLIGYTSRKLTASLHLKMDGWKTIVSFWDGLLAGTNCSFQVSLRCSMFGKHFLLLQFQNEYLFMNLFFQIPGSSSLESLNIFKLVR